MAKLYAMMQANVTQSAKPVRFTRAAQHIMALFLIISFYRINKLRKIE
jgi:hypothetical protein